MNYPIKVSVNVPVYNVVQYLPKCLDCLMAQTLVDVEFILVDDGSTDGSSAICDEYAKRDKRFQVFHKLNGGLASARQYALEKAQGEYFISCDSDDWAEPTMYEDLYIKAKADDADMVICDFFYNYPDGRQITAHSIPSNCSQDSLIRDVLMRRISGSSCNKLVRTDIYRKYNLSWESGINLGEDVFMFLKLTQYPIKVVTIFQAFYHYRRALGSNTYTNSLSVESFRQAEYIHIWKVAHIDRIKFGRELFTSSLDYAFIGIRIKDMPKDYYRSFLDKYLSYGLFFRYRLFTRKYLLILFSKLFGLSASQRIYNLFYRCVYK